MINLEFILSDGSSRMAYDVHDSEHPTRIPPGAISVRPWIGTKSAGWTLEIEGKVPPPAYPLPAFDERTAVEIAVDGIAPTSGGGAV